MGLMIVEGLLRTEQFWPTGTADADTTTIRVEPLNFYYQASPSAQRRKLRGTSFDGAVVVSKGTKAQVIKKGKMSVRLQGLDAPELHYRPTLGKQKAGGTEYTKVERKRFTNYNEDYRQIYAETAASKLGGLLKALGVEIKCKAISRVDRPTDVFDKYGRFVGDVIIRKNNKNLNINEWVLKNGLAVPGLYDSMKDDEIKTVLDAYDKGQGAIRRWYSAKVVKFNAKRIFRRNPSNPGADNDAKSGKFFLPKLFRRQATHYALEQAKLTRLNYASYLLTLGESFTLLDQFLDFGGEAETQRIGDMLDGAALRYGPTEVVFIEARSRLLDRNGSYMDKWPFA